MDSKSKLRNGKFSSEKSSDQQRFKIEKLPQSMKVEDICDENLITLKKIHAILLNCLNLNEKEKLEFCNSERYFMKLYLKKLNNKLKD
ncbi:MAG: hypothetical protein ACFFG0_22830 [Candidatus Thorarchaeota archaeon]